MAQIGVINCNKNFLGSGTVACEMLLNKQIKSFIIVPRSWKLTPSELETFDLAEAIGLVQDTTFDPFLNAVGYTDNTPDATTEDYDGGVTAVVRNGKPQWEFRYKQGLGVQKAAYSKNSFQQYAVLLVDAAGNVFGIRTAAGNFKGINLSMLNTATLKFTAGDTTSSTSVMMQVENEEEFNTSLDFITAESLGFDFNKDVMPIVNATITAVTTTAASFVISVNSLNSKGYGIEGLDETDFLFVDQSDNSTVTITSVTPVAANPGQYTIVLSGASASDVVKPYLYDTAAGVYTALVGDDLLYKGEGDAITLT